jgi:hypothetical protein
MRRKKINILFFLNFIFYSALLGTYFYFFLIKYLIQKNSLSVIYRIDFLFSLSRGLYFYEVDRRVVLRFLESFYRYNNIIRPGEFVENPSKGPSILDYYMWKTC